MMITIALLRVHQSFPVTLKKNKYVDGYFAFLLYVSSLLPYGEPPLSNV